MTSERRARRAVVLLCVALLASGAASAGTEGGSEGAEPTVAGGSVGAPKSDGEGYLQLLASIRRSGYGPGDLVEGVVGVVSTYAHEVETSGPQDPWYVEILDSRDEVVATIGPSTPWGFYRVVYPPNAYTVLAHFVWHQGTDDGEPVFEGEYRARAWLPHIDMHADSEVFRVCVDPLCDDPRDTERVYVPVAANVTGHDGRRWTSELVLRRCGEPSNSLEVSMWLLEHGRINDDPLHAIVQIGPSPTWRADNLLQEVFGFEGLGAVRIDLPHGQLKATSSITCDAPYGGRLDQDIPMLAAGDAITGWSAMIDDLASYPTDADGGARTNIGFVNLGAEPVTVDVVFAGVGDGCLDRLGDWEEPMTVRLRPYEHRQVSGVIATVTDEPVHHAVALLEAQHPRTAFLAYASVVDPVSGDARFRMATPVTYLSYLAFPCGGEDHVADLAKE